MRTYHIFQTSPLRYYVSFMLLFICLISLVYLLGSQDLLSGIPAVFPAVITVGLLFWLTVKATRYTAVAHLELSMDRTGLKKRHIRQYVFAQHPDMEILWEEIEDYVYEPSTMIDHFKITLKDGRAFRFKRNNEHDKKDDFHKFLQDFEKAVHYRNSTDDAKQHIKPGKTIYETRWALLSAYLMVMVMIATPLVFYFLPFTLTSNMYYLGPCYISAIFFVLQVYFKRRKSK